MKLVLTVALLLLSLSAFSKTVSKKQLAAEYFLNLANASSVQSFTHDQCYPRPDTSSCVKTVCDKLGPFGCDDQSEIKNVASMCSGNWGGECVQTTCGSLSSFDCDDLSELKEIALSCSQVFGNSCSRFFTKRLSTFEHDDRSEMVKINTQCKNVSPEIIDCAQYVCSKQSSFACDDFNELSDTIKSCSGH
jgi:hypothetical protein